MSDSPKTKIALCGIVLTFNEKDNLPRCLESFRALGCPVVVVDSGSTDGTREIARSRGAVVLEHPFETHAKQWAWALANLPFEVEWVVALDADQYLTEELARSLTELFKNCSDEVEGCYVRRRQVFRGTWIRHGGYYPKYLLKVFRHSKVEFDVNDLLDHHFYVRGKTEQLPYDLVEQNSKEDDIEFWISKHNRYSGLIAREELLRTEQGAAAPIEPSLWGTPDQRILFLKKLWRKMPLFIRPSVYFFYRYFLRFGWLDGKQGFIFHFLHAFWFRLLVDVKIDELRSQARRQSAAAGQ